MRNVALWTRTDLSEFFTEKNLVDIQVFGFIVEFLSSCAGELYMPKLGKQTGTGQTSARSLTVFATIIGESTLTSSPSCILSKHFRLSAAALTPSTSLTQVVMLLCRWVRH